MTYSCFKKDVYKEIFQIAIPAIGGFLGLILFDFIDIFWLEKMGTTAVASVASAGFLIGSIYSIIQIPSSSCTSLVSQFYGAGMKGRCYETIVESTWIGFIMGVIITFSLLPFMESFFLLMGLNTNASSIAMDYLRVLLYGMPFIFIDQLFGNVFNGYGDNKISNIIMIVCLIINAVLDPLLMFGWLGFPELGVTGASIATLTGHLISLVLRAYVLRRKNYIPNLKDFFCIRFKYWKEIFLIGVPNSASSLVFSLIYPILMRQITQFGEIHVSAVGVCHRLESFPYFVAQGFAVATTSLSGYYLGKHETDKIQTILDGCLKLSTIAIMPFVALCFFLPHKTINIISSDYALIDAGAVYLFIIGVFEIFMVYENMIIGLFTGIGKTLPTSFITMPFTIARIPLAWFLSIKMGMGIEGIWWAISVSTLFKGIGLMLLYKFYKKKTKNFEALAI